LYHDFGGSGSGDILPEENSSEESAGAGALPEGSVRFKPAKNRDFAILAGIGLLMIGGFIALTFKLIDQEDKHVRDVEKVHIAENFTSDSIGRYDDAATVRSIVARDPNATKCDLSAVTVDDKMMKTVSRLKRLTELNLSQSKVTDKGLKYIVGMPLKDLDLSGTVVTDEGLNIVGEKTALVKLDLSGTRITDAGLPKLAKLQSLTHFILAGTRITNAGLSDLLELKGLKRLHLSRTAITDDAFDTLEKMDLFALYLDYTAITGDGLKNFHAPGLKKVGLEACNLTDKDVPAILACMPSVAILNIGSNKITDAGLLQLAKLSNLSAIRIGSCPGITEKGQLEFKKLNPACKVDTDYVMMSK
jgi:hypothetical protein